jgi:diketogulonate reductase-like aldo/keto reductase
MKYRTFGPTGHSVSVIGMGTWRMNGDRAQAVAALRTAMDLGVNHIDTAEMYGDAELIVGEAITGRHRDDVFLVSKVLPQNASRLGTRTACERSLKRLGTDRLDCYLLHWRGSVPLEQTIGAFVDLQREGKIRSWGVSNFDADDLEEADAIEAKPGEGAACNQVLYHLKERAIEHAVIPSCEKRGIAVVAYSPFGSDDFPGPNTAGGQVLAEIAKAHAATAHQVALAFLIRHPSVFAIPKTSGPKRAAENAAACDLVLSPEDIAAIDRAFPKGAEPRSLPMI